MNCKKSVNSIVNPNPELLDENSKNMRYKKFCEELSTYIPCRDSEPKENNPSIISIVSCVFVAAVNILSSRCSAKYSFI
jgi:hypothetical protein